MHIRTNRRPARSPARLPVGRDREHTAGLADRDRIMGAGGGDDQLVAVAGRNRHRRKVRCFDGSNIDGSPRSSGHSPFVRGDTSGDCGNGPRIESRASRQRKKRLIQAAVVSQRAETGARGLALVPVKSLVIHPLLPSVLPIRLVPRELKVP